MTSISSPIVADTPLTLPSTSSFSSSTFSPQSFPSSIPSEAISLPTVLHNVHLSADFARRVLAHRYLPFNLPSSAPNDTIPVGKDRSTSLPSFTLFSSTLPNDSSQFPIYRNESPGSQHPDDPVHEHANVDPSTQPSHVSRSLSTIYTPSSPSTSFPSLSALTNDGTVSPSGILNPRTPVPTVPSSSPFPQDVPLPSTNGYPPLSSSPSSLSRPDHAAHPAHIPPSTNEENSSLIYEPNSFTHRTNISSSPDTLSHENTGSGTYNSITGSSIVSDFQQQHLSTFVSSRTHPIIENRNLHLSQQTLPSSSSAVYLSSYTNSPSLPLQSTIPDIPTSTTVNNPHSTTVLEDHNYLTVGSQTDAISFLGITTAHTENNLIEIDNVSYSLPSLFGIVEDGVYRCGYPTPDQFPFLHQLRIRTVINLLDKLPVEYEEFLKHENIQYIHNSVKGNKAHCEEMDRKKVAYALSIIMDIRNHPLLIHCRSGKHRTGALVGCLRMLQRWSLEATCDEYVYYCKHKQRYVDKQYIERFNPQTLRSFLPPTEHLPPWLPSDCTEHVSVLQEAIERGEIRPEEAEYGLPVSAMTKGPDEPGVIYQAVIRAHVAAAVAAEAAASAREKATVPVNGDSGDGDGTYRNGEEPSVLYESSKYIGESNEKDYSGTHSNNAILRTPTKKGSSYPSVMNNAGNGTTNDWLLRDPSSIAPGSGNSTTVIQGYLSASPKDPNPNISSRIDVMNIENSSSSSSSSSSGVPVYSYALSSGTSGGGRSPRSNTLNYDTSPGAGNWSTGNGGMSGSSNSNRNAISSSSSSSRSTILPGKDGASIFTPPRLENHGGINSTTKGSTTNPSLTPSRTSVMNALVKGVVPTGLEGRISPINVSSEQEKKG